MTPSLKFRYRRLAALTLALLALSACGGSAEESAAPSPLISARSYGHIPVLRTPAATVCNRCKAASSQNSFRPTPAVRGLKMSFCNCGLSHRFRCQKTCATPAANTDRKR
ncbi:hypothetical protein [Acidovorax temperans]|uniref:hypothetical protein n=1 Tax=Acidovorax temperans TaxID=80878 RepID=UPI0028A14711|nr:hypothetical protein [Acidovorax temperans]